MRSVPLYQKKDDGTFDPIKAHYCGSCGNVYGSIEAADHCCCCCLCGEEIPYDGKARRFSHRDCELQRDEDRRKNRALKATTIPYSETDSDMFYVDEWDQYFSDPDEFSEYLGELQFDNAGMCPKSMIPPYVYPCDALSWRGLCIDTLIFQVLEDYLPENVLVEDLVHGLKELREAVSIFNEKNKRLESYWPDYTKKIPIESLGVLLVPETEEEMA